MKTKNEVIWFPKPGKRERPEQSWKTEVMQCDLTCSCSGCAKTLYTLMVEKFEK